jgi:ribonuclease R
MSKKKTKALEKAYKQQFVTDILELLKKNPGKNFSFSQIATALDLRFGDQKTLLGAILDNLAETGLVAHDNGKYQGHEQKQQQHIIGKVDMATAGNAYIVSQDSKQDIFVASRDLGDAFHGDTVKVYVFPQRKAKRPEGEVVEVIQRGRTEFVGRIEVAKNFAFLLPDNNRINFDIFIPMEKLKGAKNGDKAIVRIIEWPQGGKNPKGEVTEVLGKAGENNTEIIFRKK